MKILSKFSVFLFPVPLTTSPTLVLDDAGANNDDQDGNANNEHAILIEGMTYHFQCNYAADTVNPHPHIRWNLYNSAGALITTASETDTGGDQTCPAPAYSQSYELTADRVTFANLQCGFLVCTAYTDDAPLAVTDPNPYVGTNQYKDRIDFQIWSKYLSFANQFYFCLLRGPKLTSRLSH